MKTSVKASARSTTKKKKITIMVCICIVVLAGLWLGRGWVRTSGVSAYAIIFYKPSVGKHFDENYKTLAPSLKKLGFTTTATTLFYRCSDGDEIAYQAVHVSAHCIKLADFSSQPFSSRTLAAWKSQSPQFEQQLLTDGWKKQYDQAQPIQDIYDYVNKDTSTGVDYSKAYGKVQCHVSITFNPSVAKQPATHASLSCERSVAFFGGY